MDHAQAAPANRTGASQARWGTSHCNEALDRGGTPREFYRSLLEGMERIGPQTLTEKRARAEEELRRLGATFPLPGGGENRILPADWVPRIIPEDHWEELSYGLLQRGWAINAWLTDLYHGDQDVVPEEIVNSSVFHKPERLPDHFLPVPVHVYGPDVVHLESADYAVLRATLEAAAPPDAGDPGIAIVTGGPGDPAYFEHSRIAEACGIRLLTLGDLRVSGGAVLAQPDGQRIDVIYRRVDGGYVVADLPELEDTYRKGGVNLVNALGVGVADDKAVFPYVPAMIERYLGEEPVLRNAPTISLWDAEERSAALERLPELVLKPRDGYGGRDVLIGPEADRESIERARRDVTENPTGFVAQECLDFSTHVLDGEAPSGEAFVDLRALVLPAIGYVMPGGLTRVAKPGTRIVNSSSGGSFKDTWVLEEGP